MNTAITAFVYHFEREAVEANDLRHFLDLYPARRLPRGELLRDYFDSFIFAIDGYGSDSRQFCTIPEVRRFYRHFYREWPLWWFCCNLDLPNLLQMSLCCIDDVRAVRQDGAATVSLVYQTSEMDAFVDEGFARTRHLFARAGMTSQEAEQRRQVLSDYFRRAWPAVQNR